MKKGFRNYLLSGLVFIAILVIWKVAVMVLKTPTHILPPPEAILFRFIKLIETSVLQKSVLATFEEILYGFSSGAALGILFGYIPAKLPVLEKALSP
ncbi:MAG TPA: hypothetical protein PLF98_05680, partial [Thermotogota bacterium]|nr:hypothetical protein [Thermotogota bacterium]